MGLLVENELLGQIFSDLEKEVQDEFEPNYLLKHALRLFELSNELNTDYSIEELFGTCYLIAYKFCGDDSILYAYDISRIIRSRLVNNSKISTNRIKKIEIKILKIINYDIVKALKLHRLFSPKSTL